MVEECFSSQDVPTRLSRHPPQTWLNLPRGARSGFAEVSLVANAAPTGGHVEATPRAGVAALDTFTLESLDWSDDVDDLPLTYAFSSRVCTKTKRDIVRRDTRAP